MKRNLFLNLIGLLFFTFSVFGQGGSENELKTNAETYFEAQNFQEAKLLYAQLLSLYPKDATYNYRYGACVLQTEADKTKPLKYLEFAASKASVDPLAFYYLGKAYHLNYEFAKAVKLYSKFKNEAKSDARTKYDVERQIEMAINGNNLLSKLNEVQVIDRQEIALKDFYRIYDEELIDGKLIAKPEEFRSKLDKKVDDKSVIFLPSNANEVYYSSLGKKGENGRDIYKSVKLGNGEWSEGVSLGNSINTKYDEDYAYIKPDGRTLYFASKGHSSMGGYDLFKSVLDPTTNQWTAPENLDFAFSSADDDILFVTDPSGEIAYFASNRSNEFGKITVYKVLTKRIPAELSAISGKFYNESNPAEKQAKITVIDKASKQTIGVYETDKTGAYTIEIAQNGGDFQFNIETNDDAPIHTGTVTIPKQSEFEVLGQELRLVGEGDNQQLVIKNIFDGTALAVDNGNGQGPKISSETIKLKASLAVNYSASELAELMENQRLDRENDLGKEQLDNEETSTEEVQNQTNSDSNDNELSPSIDVAPPVASVTASNIKSEVNEIKNEVDELVATKQKIITQQYAKSLKLEQAAKELFSEVENLKENNEESVAIQLKEKEASLTALKAAYAAQTAKLVEESLNKDLSLLTEIESSENKINKAIEDENLAGAELELNNIKQSNQKAISVEQILKNSLGELDDRERIANKKVTDYSARNSSIKSEFTDLDQQLKKLELELENAPNKRKEEIQSSIDNTKLDVEDLAFQQTKIEENFIEAELSKKALEIEKTELLSAINQINSTELGNEVTEEEKNRLINQLKLYRDNNQLAFSAANELYRNEVILPAISIPTTTESELADNQDVVEDVELGGVENVDITNVPLSTLNENYNSALNSADLLEDTELKLATKIRVYEEWLDELKARKEILQQQYDAEIDETIRANSNAELTEINKVLTEKQRLKNQLEQQMQARVAGNYLEEAVAIADINEVNSGTIVKTDFTNFNFNQTYEASTAESSTHLTEAKRNLYQASEFSKQSEQAQQAAYNLPTAEERTQAFTKANDLKALSEEKQLQAAEQFATFNLKEFRLNQAKLSNANQFDSRYNSASLEMAELLQEEAETYFTDAAVIRSAINPNDRLSQKQVELQKAYDYEMMALEKQKEALSKLGNVVSETVNNRLGNSTPAQKVPFIQVIDDENILSIVTVEAADKQRKVLQANIETINAKIQETEQEIYNLDEGVEKDSLKSSVASLNKEKEESLTNIALITERERQIKEGLVGVSPVNSEPSTKVLKFKKAEVLTQVAIDTVEISDERKSQLLNSQGYISFANNRAEIAKQVKAAEISYQEAIDLAEENNRLRKQAVIESNKAKFVNDDKEKQRLIKSATVINQTIAANETRIEAINRSIKVKNFLVINLEKKDREMLSSLTNAEKLEFQSLSASIIPENLAIVTTTFENDLVETEVPSERNELTSTETSKTSENLPLLPAGNSTEQPMEKLNDDLVQVPKDSEIKGRIDKPEPPFTESNQSGEQDILENNAIKEVPTNAIPSKSNAEVEAAKIIQKPVRATTERITLDEIDLVPRKMKQAIFVTLNKNVAAYNDAKPIPVKKELPEGIVYKVQIGAFRNPISPATFKGFAPLMKEKAGNGITRYTAGIFANESNAILARNQIRNLGYIDAFVVAFKDGERISISKAREVSKNSFSTTEVSTFEKLESSEALSISPATKNNVKPVKGGSKAALNTSFNAPEVEEVVNTETVEGLIYTVQIGVYSKPVKKGTFNYKDLNVVQISNNLYRYNAGLFESAISAAELKNTISVTIPDAFVAAYYNGKRVSLEEAAKLKN